MNTLIAERPKRSIFVRLSTVMLVILTFALAAVLFFGYFYLNRISIVNTITNTILPYSKQKYNIPYFRYAIYGNIDSNVYFSYPTDVAVVGGKIYVTDQEAGNIKVFDYNGKLIRVFGEKGVNAGQLANPYGIAVRGNKIYVADASQGKIAIYSTSGQYLEDFRVKAEGITFSPANLMIARDRLYVSDVYNSRILVFDFSGRILDRLGRLGSGKGQLKYPHGLAMDRVGNLYVADSGNNRIVVFDPKGKYLKTIGGLEEGIGSLTTIRDVAISNSGHLYTALSLPGTIRVFNLEGKEIGLYGGNGNKNGQFALPNSIAVDSNNRIYITELFNKRVSVFDERR